MNDNISEFNTCGSDSFTFRNNVFTTEMSSLGSNFRFQVDAQGIPSFYMRSHVTGKVAHFFFIVDARSSENEVQSWTFRCGDAGMKHLTAIIIND